MFSLICILNIKAWKINCFLFLQSLSPKTSPIPSVEREKRFKYLPRGICPHPRSWFSSLSPWLPKAIFFCLFPSQFSALLAWFPQMWQWNPEFLNLQLKLLIFSNFRDSLERLYLFLFSSFSTQRIPFTVFPLLIGWICFFPQSRSSWFQ